MTAVLLHPGPLPVDTLASAVRRALPFVEVRIWPDLGVVEDIEYALVSRIPPGQLANLPKLRLIGSLHAGVDHLLADQSLPTTADLVRAAPAEGDTLLSDYVLAQVMWHHRDMATYAMDKINRRWHKRPPRPFSASRVGVLGLGLMGLPVANVLSKAGFDVSGWRRRFGTVQQFPVFSGPAGLEEVLKRSDILVNVLPLTPATAKILNAVAFNAMPVGSTIINVGRGEHIVDDDLIEALKSGQLSAATLDVFRQEPLPEEHIFWNNPRITITPHACRNVSLEATVLGFARDIALFRSGRRSPNLVDRAQGY